MAKESKHVVKFKETHLKQGEKVISVAIGYIGEMMGKKNDTQFNGALIVTGERVIFYRKGLLGEVFEAIPLKGITSIERKSGIMSYTLTLHTSGNKIVFKSIEKKESAQLASDIERIQHTDEPVKSESVNVEPEEDAFAKIKKLAELKEMGVISEDEFNEKKTKLLAEI